MSKCPICDAEVAPHAKNKLFPFCSTRCKTIDLGKWLTNPENQFTYEKTHGLTPLRPVDGVKDLVAQDASWKPFLDGIGHGGPEPLFLDYKGFQNAIIDMVQSVVTGTAQPKDALTKAAGAIEAFK